MSKSEEDLGASLRVARFVLFAVKDDESLLSNYMDATPEASSNDHGLR